MRERAKTANLRRADVLRRAALAVLSTVVTSTPVDTGRARSNWLVSTTVRASGVVQPRSAGETIQAGQAALIGLKASKVLITNNVSYIRGLNAGSSRQAPANFVERAVSLGLAQIQKTKLFK